MSFNSIIKKIYDRLHNSKGRIHRHSVIESKRFLSRFPEPVDDLQRAFFQYKCQKWDSMTKTEFIISNVVSFVAFIPQYVQYRRNNIEYEKKYDALVTLEFLGKMLPEDFHGTYIIHQFDCGCLSKDEIKILKELIQQHPFSFYFLYKVMCRLASYSAGIIRYCPEIIFSSSEYSFTSSILTYYCEKKGVQHVNIMHGEKLFNPREAFSRYTKFYIWDEYYKELFKSMRAIKTNYIVQCPHYPEVKPIKRNNHYTYYLQLHTHEQLLRIKQLMDKLECEYMVRPHPVYASGEEIKIFGENHVEKNTVNIWDSLKEAGNAISQDSTVLFQAYKIGIPIIIDDLSDKDYYSELSDRGYIMTQKDHRLLSDCLNFQHTNDCCDQEGIG